MGEGRNLFVYPFAGRQAHLGLAALLGYRIGQGTPSTFFISMNDYGFELLSPVECHKILCQRSRSANI
jgi:ATP-dependent helicase Lhr and Lhr-like helicase